ncbi:MAG: dipeptidase [Gemmatimonadales bacterium]|jgi:acetylornithine deacetylase/succinyl-diaminopimelate desuccinylase-like protein|nr:MAG: dipeptidase [Gemmatimonadales bacterium]
MQETDRFIQDNLARYLDEFAELVAIRSISTDPAYAGEVAEAAEWVSRRMTEAGLEAEIHHTEGHPLVVGRHHAGPDAPTLLVYAHYDVQPADPEEEWRSPPFQLTRDGDDLVARGAADDKAQVILQIAAAEAALQSGTLPVNLILLFEGEEEVGSVHLTPFVARNRESLATDHAVIADSMMFSRARPSLIFGMRGVAYVEIEATGAGRDLHSGQYGGAVPNPVHALARIIASFHDGTGRVAVPGFYDRVREVPAGLREAWRGLGYDEEAFRGSAGGASLTGEPGFATHERLWIRPCLDVNGIVGGYTGPGKKTVLPGRASAKVSCRLVPDQDPEEIIQLLKDHIARQAPEGVQLRVTGVQANPPFLAEPSGPLFDAASRALEEVYGVEPARVAHGGTLPIARDFAELLTPSVAVLGFALPGANMHAPNEWIPSSQVEKGIRSMVRLYAGLAAR